MKNYKEKQEVNKKKYKKEYYSYCLEEVKNKYGKIIEYRIIEVKDNRRLSNKINLVFTNRCGKYSGTESIRYPFKVIHNEMGLKDYRFYNLRGTYASKILRSGVEIRDVADLLGHRKIETTENYYITSTEETRKEASINIENIIKSEVINEIIKIE